MLRWWRSKQISINSATESTVVELGPPQIGVEGGDWNRKACQGLVAVRSVPVKSVSLSSRALLSLAPWRIASLSRLLKNGFHWFEEAGLS